MEKRRHIENMNLDYASMRKQQSKSGSSSSKDSELNQKFKDLRSLIESQRLRVHLLDLKAAIMGGTHIIFQALMYALVIYPSSSSSAAVAPPKNLWFPACLSASASVAFWPAFTDTVGDCMRTRRQQESSFTEQERVYRKMSSDGGAAAAQRSLDKAFASVRRQRRAYVGALYFTLLLFTLSVPCVLLFNLQREFQNNTVTDAACSGTQSTKVI